jgi:hypothetical protein
MHSSAYNLTSDDYFSRLYTREVLSRVADKEEMVRYDYYESVFQQALNLAKKKQMEDSVALFLEGEQKLAEERVNGSLNALMWDCWYPKKAYLYYKQKRMSLARMLTYRSIITNERLKRTGGFNFLVFIQIQQYHNIARIFFAESKLAYGIRLSYRLIWFLLTQQSVGVKYLDKIDHPVSDESSQLRCAMTYQVMFEMLGVLARAKNNVAHYLKSLIIFLQEIIPFFNAGNEREYTLRNFLTVFTGIDLEDRSRYISAANHFLQTEKDMFPNTEKVIKLFY